MKNSRIFRKLLAFVTVALGVAIPSFAQDFAGETITVVIPNPAGSGGDIHGRIFARYFARHLPGEPNVIVANRPGAGTLTAQNLVYETGDPDGTMLCYCGLPAGSILADAPGIRFVIEEMAHIGSAADNMAFIARNDVVTEPSDLIGSEAIVIGGRGAGASMDIFGNLGLETISANYRYVPGFEGFSKISAAIIAGEVGAGHAGQTGYQQFFAGVDDVNPVFYHPMFDEDGEPQPAPETAWDSDIPSIVEVHEAIHGTAPSGDWWEAYRWYRMNVMSATIGVTGPPGMDPAVEASLQRAFNDAVSDPDYLAEYRATIGEPPVFNSTALTKKIFTEFRSVPAAVQAAIVEISSR